MKRSLVFKLILCYIIMISTIFIIVNIFGLTTLSSNTTNSYFTKLRNSATTIVTNEDVLEFLKDGSNKEDFYKYIKNTSSLIDTKIWIVNSEGQIIYDTSGYTNSLNEKNINDFSKHFLSNKEVFQQTFSPLTSEECYFYVAKAMNNSTVAGYVVSYIPTETVSSIQVDNILLINQYILLFLPVIAAIFVLIYFMCVAPIHKITKYALDYSKGKFDQKIDSTELKIKANDELRQLADAIQYMAGELNNLDEYQRKFIGNISHDFRSPLTSIKGYVEAMIDGTIPLENHEKYLKVILFESERLTNLTTNLLTLNNFDNNKRILNKTSFDINYILRKTCDVYEGRCAKNKIEMIFNCESYEQYVFADQSQIQQVINNLVDNAIKFSPQYSKIVLSTFVRNEKVFVSVKDSGTGIPKTSINKIWDRFYKIDPSRGKDKKGTGLGLAITKEIINAHHENINVISTEGVGTEFIFTLTKPKA